MQLAQHCSEEGAGVVSPTPVGSLVIRNQRPRELIAVLQLPNLLEQIPANRSCIERIQNDIAAIRAVVALEIACVRIRNDGPIPARKCARQQLVDGSALTRAGGPEQLEMLR